MSAGMRTEPDGVEVVARRSDAAALARPPLLVIESLEAFLDARGLGSGPIAWQRIGDGQSNVTYLLRRGETQCVLRRGPRPPLPRSTHDMLRESRIQQLVGRAGIAVPEILAVCEDDSVLGVPFYLMGYLDGVVITEDEPAALAAAQMRRATAFTAVDQLVQLHALDVTSGGLEVIGRPDGYLARQVKTFSGLWEQVTTRAVPAVTDAGRWLAENIPVSQRAALVHGDYRIGNLMFAHGAPPRVLAILDWEMATLGDPLADLGYFLATYGQDGTAATPLELTPVTRLEGYPTRAELAERYAAATGFDLTDLRWYQALAMWKAAVFCEAIYTRWLNGERPGDEFAPTLLDGVPALAEEALRFIEGRPGR
ncbi:phosphotransferase family protein [Microbacterium sp. H1-D42]|uniref:phosphotransferase family protein n=1 Tax=Microbacterium sp. H1-D42 TaxID=2925844 RepID=UPI001F52BDE3|nr:phosphotransferase family protein [Microbacterium sp. H1-D42]UNK71493.1 phosphotransferase family protein [Microbacterium sp. H1-D42]